MPVLRYGRYFFFSFLSRVGLHIIFLHDGVWCWPHYRDTKSKSQYIFAHNAIIIVVVTVGYALCLAQNEAFIEIYVAYVIGFPFFYAKASLALINLGHGGIAS